jgi:chromosome segregation ATPase
VLYLAEVKKTKGFMGAKTEVKLLACERNDKSWAAVPNEDVLNIDDVGTFGDGALIVVNLSGSRQIQGSPESASNRILTILQNFSRLLDKTKSQEEEIEQWKQSLTFQAEELNRRQVEMEQRLEELEGAEEELQQLAAERDAVAELKAGADEIKAEFERKQAELEGAWEHLRGEQQLLEGQQGDGNGAVQLDAEQTERLKAIFEQIQGAIAPTDNFLERLDGALHYAEQQQQHLQQAWDALEQDRQLCADLQEQVSAIATEIQQTENNLQGQTHSLENARVQMQVQQELLKVKQEHLQSLNLTLQNHEELKESLSSLAAGLGDVEGETVDTASLESMPLGELEDIVNILKGELDKLVHFVNDQEEELTLQQQAVKELRKQIEQVDSNDVMALQELEEELKDEQERIGMLNETLVGQRRTLRERQSVMKQNLKVLKQRQGVIEIDLETNIDLNPAIARMESDQQEYREKQAQLAQEIDQISQSIQNTHNVLTTQESDVRQQSEKLKERKKEYEVKHLDCEKIKSKVELYEASLRPLQDSLDGITQPLRELEQLTHQFSSATEQQQTLAGELETTLAPLMGN